MKSLPSFCSTLLRTYCFTLKASSSPRSIVPPGGVRARKGRARVSLGTGDSAKAAGSPCPPSPGPSVGAVRFPSYLGPSGSCCTQTAPPSSSWRSSVLVPRTPQSWERGTCFKERGVKPKAPSLWFTFRLKGRVGLS